MRYREMVEVGWEDYENFRKEKGYVEVGGVRIELTGRKLVKTLGPPAGYELEKTTVWSFPDRGSWATHRGNYRGNWSPYIPRNLILKYTEEGDTVLDPMMGSGTTLVEARILGRKAIGVDINYESVMLALDRLNFEVNDMFKKSEMPEIRTYWGDARNLDKVPSSSIDLVATHPPYANIIVYSRRKTDKDDLSHLSFPEYLEGMKVAAAEFFRVLKPGRVCAILIGDTRKHKHYIPISHYVLEAFLEVGFVLLENIVKVQHNMKGTRERWRGKNYDFYLITHEQIFVFRKPESEKEYRKYRFSSHRERGRW